jgi:hypothetical protein
VDGTKRRAIDMEIELEGEVVKKMDQIEVQCHYLSLDAKCLTTHKNTPKGMKLVNLQPP